ncbi:hypothetical protein A2U01_0079924, partial [Trifolium medium]|nr:hypothetical protein [Trifolium medium]
RKKGLGAAVASCCTSKLQERKASVPPSDFKDAVAHRFMWPSYYCCNSMAVHLVGKFIEQQSTKVKTEGHVA